MGGEVATIRCKRQQHLHAQTYPKLTKKKQSQNRTHYRVGQPNQDFSLKELGNLENIIKISPKLISRAITKDQTAKGRRRNIREWEDQESPPQEAVDDMLATIEKTPTLFLSADMNKVFNILAAEGHAQNAHATYNEMYVNATINNMIESIGQKGTPLLKRKFARGKFQNLTQEYCDNTVEILAKGLIGMKDVLKRGKKLEKISLHGLNNITCFGDVNPLEAARGFFLTANMDTFRGIRTLGFQKYGHQLGGGECFLASTKRLKELGIGISDMSELDYKGSLEILNRLPNEKRLRVLEDLKVITRNTLPLEDIARGELTWEEIKSHSSTTDLIKNPGSQSQYIRDIHGYGVGDDLAIFLAGFLPASIYNKGHVESPLAIQSKIIGGLLGDQMDTLEKSTRIFIPGGQDKIAGKYLNGIWNKLAQDPVFRKAYDIKEQPDGVYNLLNLDEIVDFTMAGANREGEHVHSSQRYFWKNEDGTCAVTEYMKYAYFCAKVQNKEMKLSDIRKFKIKPEKDIENIKLTFQRIHAKKILSIMSDRLYLVSDSKKTESRLRQYYLPN